MRRVILAAALASTSAGAAAAEFRSTEDLQYWAPIILHAPNAGKVRGSFELSPRSRGDFRRLNQLVIRPSLGFAVSSRLDLHAGYVWVRSDTGVISDEHRAWQQATLKHAAFGAAMSLRGRLEQRWLEGLSSPAWRGRLLLRGEHPFGAGPWYAVVSNELFTHLASPRGGPPHGIDQNRLYAGVGRKGAGRALMEVGYQHWWLRRRNAPDVVFHVLVLTSHWDLSRLAAARRP